MTALNLMKDFVEGIARGFGLFLTQRHTYVETTLRPGIVGRKQG